MLNEGNVHYEISLIHQSISNLLKQNKGLELGELTPAWTESDIVNKDVMRDFLDLASHVISKIDGVGAKNIGTAHRSTWSGRSKTTKPETWRKTCRGLTLLPRNTSAASEVGRPKSSGTMACRTYLVWVVRGSQSGLWARGGIVAMMRSWPDDSASVANAPSQHKSSRFDSRSAGAAKIAGDYW